MKIKILSNNPGQCPYCNSENITYSSIEEPINNIGYIYKECHCNDCGLYFEEWYTLQFEGMNVGDHGQFQAEDFEEIEYDAFKDPLRISRCANCACLVEHNGKYYCDEMQNYCEDIERCIYSNEED